MNLKTKKMTDEEYYIFVFGEDLHKLCRQVYNGEKSREAAAKELGWPLEVFDDTMVYWIGG